MSTSPSEYFRRAKSGWAVRYSWYTGLLNADIIAFPAPELPPRPIHRQILTATRTIRHLQAPHCRGGCR